MCALKESKTKGVYYVPMWKRGSIRNIARLVCALCIASTVAPSLASSSLGVQLMLSGEKHHFVI